MTFRFGPDTVAPLCVQSEQEVLTNPQLLTKCCLVETCLKTLGGYFSTTLSSEEIRDLVEAETKFYFTVNKYLDVDCNDEILFLDASIEDFYSIWPAVIEYKFCLSKPVDVYHLR